MLSASSVTEPRKYSQLVDGAHTPRRIARGARRGVGHRNLTSPKPLDTTCTKTLLGEFSSQCGTV